MIKTFVVTFFAAFICGVAFSQQKRVDSIRHQLTIAKDDTSRILTMADLSFAYNFQNFDSATLYADKAIELAKQIHFPRGEIRGMYSKATILETSGDMPEALELGFNGLEIAEKQNLQLETSICLTLIGDVFYDLNDYTKAISFFRRAVSINDAIKNQTGTEFWKWQTEVNYGAAFMLNNQPDSALAHLQNAYVETLHNDIWHPVFLMFLGQLKFRMGKQDTGLNYLHESLRIFENNNDSYSTSDACRIIAGCFKEKNEIDSSIFYAGKALLKAQLVNYRTSILDASKLLAEAYESKDIKQALYFRKVFDTTNDILYGPNKVKGLQKTLSDQEDRQRKNEAEKMAYQNQIKQYALLAGLIIFLLIGFILYRNNHQEKKANILLQQQKEKAESTLSELKSTQQQLIQSEKMASLGELTAGIAHEIQNPLNFVNNFSDVNKELLEELKGEADKGNLEEVKTIASDVIANEEKINHHGKRADAIVKNMLQHSRKSSGQKEPTDINALCDEYLRLAYHGMRAKDKSFNAEFKTEFDNAIGKINIVPQDIGRVLLNLINNAFYAVNEKSKLIANGYQPMASVTTKQIGNSVLITVKDNGNGIPASIKDKIFQPFFTTKPTGQGTGLGLSLAYDIITKEHNGTIKVESPAAGATTQGGEENDGTTFTVQLPQA
jgi:signal transduction histidine kinase